MPNRPKGKRPTQKRITKSRAPLPTTLTPPPSNVDQFFQHVLALTNRRTETRTLVAIELAKLHPPSSEETPGALATPIRRQANLKALQTWHSVASARLEDLRAGRSGTGSGAQPIPPSRQPEVLKLKRRLVVGLTKNAGRISTLQGTQRRWHLAAKAARDGIRLRAETARDVLGAALKPDAQLHLKLAHATFMVEGNSPRIRNDLKDAVAQMPKSKGLRYWLARYEIMAGHYQAASQAVSRARDYLAVRQIVLPMLEPESTDAPWLSWPCNFYTYRYTLAETSELLGMQKTLGTLANDPELEETWNKVFKIPLSAIQLLKERSVDGSKACTSLLLWNQAHQDMGRNKYANAASNYEACQRAIVDYFASRYDKRPPKLKLTMPSPPDESGSDPSPEQQLDSALDILARSLINYSAPTRQIWTYFRERYMTLTLKELQQHDWQRPKVVPLAYEFADPLPQYGDSTDPVTALVRLLTQMSILKSLQLSGEKVEEKLDAPLLAMALVFCPMAIAEANRLRRHFDKALTQCTKLLRRHSDFKILSEVIEKPFAKILKAQILLDKADTEYKARAMSKPPAPGTNPGQPLKYQGLEAAETYQGVLLTFQDQGQYVNRVNEGVAAMTTQLQELIQHTFHPIAVKQAEPGSLPPLTTDDRLAFTRVGKKIPIETIKPRQGEYPEPDRRVSPHQPLLKFEGSDETSPALLETNPIVYSMLMQARARLLQMESGLNYLGYSDDYIPPWRFQFMLDRARYFAEHAKNAQREYLNFLSNAEREEFQELTAAQTVEMEKSNIRIETARVDQVRAEVETSKASAELAELSGRNASARLERYAEMDERIHDLETESSIWSTIGGIGSMAAAIAAAPATGGASTIVAVGSWTALVGQTQAGEAQTGIAGEQREYEKFNLTLAAQEAAQAAIVAQRQLAVAQAGLLVSGMQRAAAVLRHEFALQNLAFLRNRTLNAEMWYRLSAAIRGVGDTYLRYGIEMAFLAEQAYEFEADKRINVIRFDYDVSDLGDMLAGDFLLRDLDTLEQDLIVGQRIRQQQVRYVLSLSREFPEALQELRHNGAMTFSLRLEQLERRFPGLFNLRISSVDVLPLALMDATRFNLQLTQLGIGQVRLKAEPNIPAESLGTDWLGDLDTDWSIRFRTTPPETAVFSGLTRQDIAGAGSFFAANQRGAFEGLPGASAWEVDLSMKENRIVPDSLADLLITFTLSGYYDPLLRVAVDHAPHKARATTSWFSGRQNFPDGFYEFNQTGRMDWQVTPDLLSLDGAVGALRNVAVLCTPSQRRLELGRLICSYPIEFEVDAAGKIQLFRELPQFAFSTSGLVLNATLNTPSGSTVTFDFGDGTGLADSTALPHTYARPGRYDVLVRIAGNGRLTEYRAAVVVSRQHTVQPPCIVLPVLKTTVADGSIKLEPSLQATGETLTDIWQIDLKKPDAGSNPATFTLDPGRYVLRLSAIRPLTAQFYSRQRYVTEVGLSLSGLHLATNRTFDADTGAETTTDLNAFGQHVFGAGTLSPVDHWTLELPLEDNLCAVSVSSTDAKQHDLSELADAVLVLENEIADG